MEFQFKGGIVGNEKIHVFIVINGYEQIIYEALKNGLVKEGGLYRYKTAHALIKVFVSQVVSQTQIDHSFFVQLSDEQEAPEITITNVDRRAGLFFKAKGQILKKSEAVALLAEDNPSRFYLKTLASALLASMVSVRTSDDPVIVPKGEGRIVGRKKARKEEARA